jgi:hypothetical protein
MNMLENIKPCGAHVKQSFKEKGPSLRKHLSWTGKPGSETSV